MHGMINRVFGYVNPPVVFATADEMLRHLDHDHASFLSMLLHMGRDHPLVELILLLLESTSRHTYEDILRMIDMLSHIVLTNGALAGEPTLEVFPVVRVVSWVERQSDGVVESVRLAVPKLVVS